ncbi:MAG: helix-turn-helix transcriptional regulator [Myxococcales bacterium]|nr:helix-turn-helix transcriptional regulator [Myxococcales bacterium]
MHSRFRQANCSVAKALDAIGDGWSLMILRECFFGTRRFVDFQRSLGIAKNILSQRLQHLEEHGVLARIDAGRHGQRFEYALTPAGKDLATVMTALRQWGDRWIHGPGNEPMLVLDRRTGRPIPPVRIADEDGQPMATHDMAIVPGPGATADTLQRFRRIAEGES